VSTLEGGLTWTAAYHLAALPLAACGMLPPAVAAAAAASCPAVLVLRALRLRKVPSVRPTVIDAADHATDR
jgi:Cu+-exporting ATPase